MGKSLVSCFLRHSVNTPLYTDQHRNSNRQKQMPLIIASSYSVVFIIIIRPKIFRKEGINFNPLAVLGYSDGM